MRSFKEFYGDAIMLDSDRDNLLEQLAKIEHDQWMAWATSLMENENLSQDRMDRWSKLMIPYEELSEEMKDFDREYAMKVLKVIEGLTEATTLRTNIIQAKAFRKLGGDKNDVIMELIKKYGSEFRSIIDEFEQVLGRIPSADDLIWVAGVHTKQDPRQVVKQIINNLSKK